MNIPENGKLEGFQYGAFWSNPPRGQSSHWLRRPGGPWVMALTTPAADELPDDYVGSYWEAAEELAKDYVRDMQDADNHHQEALEEAFRGMFHRDPDDTDREQGLWSLLCS